MKLRLQILNKDFKPLAVMENTKKNLPLFSVQNRESLEPLNELTLTVPEKVDDSIYMKVGNYLLYRDEEGNDRLFIISVVDEVDAEYKDVQCEHISTELADEHISVFSKDITTAFECLNSLMSGSSWSVGVVDEFDLQPYSAKYTNRLDALTGFAERYGGELVFETTFVGNELKRTVHFVKRRGTFSGKRFEYGKDILNISRTVDMSEVKTALYGYGTSSKNEQGTETRLTFTGLSWSKANGNLADKPAGQAFIENKEAMKLFGLDNGTKHRFGMYDSGDDKDSETLLYNTYVELMKRSTPKITYEMSVVELERVAGYKHEKVRLGDDVIVLDYEFQEPIKVSARVIEIKRDLLNPEKTEVVLGNFKELFSSIYDRMKELEDELNNNAGIWDSKLDALSTEHYAEFGTLVYEGTASTVLDYNFAQVYRENPVIHVQMQLFENDNLDDFSENITFQVKPLKKGEYFVGGKIKVNRTDTTNRRFGVTIQAFCSVPLDVEEA